MKAPVDVTFKALPLNLKPTDRNHLQALHSTKEQLDPRNATHRTTKPRITRQKGKATTYRTAN